MIRKNKLKQIKFTSKILLALLLVSALLLAAPTGVRAAPTLAAQVLYNGALNTTPDNQGFTYLTNPLTRAQAQQTAENGVTILDTTPAKTDSAGYFARQVPTLNRTVGFTASFTLQIMAEDHAGSDKNGDGVGDRAGFSVILLSNDKKGVEIGFWKDKVWIQDDGAKLFIQAEGKSFNTTTGLIRYDLTIRGDGYTLFADGTQLLRGPVRDYSSFGWPYSTPNFFFLGDDTSSASAKFKLAAASINNEVQTNTTPTSQAQPAPTATVANRPPSPTPVTKPNPTAATTNNPVGSTPVANANPTVAPAQGLNRLLQLTAQGLQQIGQKVRR